MCRNIRPPYSHTTHQRLGRQRRSKPSQDAKTATCTARSQHSPFRTSRAQHSPFRTSRAQHSPCKKARRDALSTLCVYLTLWVKPFSVSAGFLASPSVSLCDQSLCDQLIVNTASCLYVTIPIIGGSYAYLYITECPPPCVQS